MLTDPIAAIFAVSATIQPPTFQLFQPVYTMTEEGVDVGIVTGIMMADSKTLLVPGWWYVVTWCSGPSSRWIDFPCICEHPEADLKPFSASREY